MKHKSLNWHNVYRDTSTGGTVHDDTESTAHDRIIRDVATMCILGHEWVASSVTAECRKCKGKGWLNIRPRGQRPEIENCADCGGNGCITLAEYHP